MPPRDNPNLREMRALLQEMKAMNDEGLQGECDLDHLGFSMPSFKSVTNYFAPGQKDQEKNWNEAVTKWTPLTIEQKKSILKTLISRHITDSWTSMKSLLVKEQQMIKDESQRKTALDSHIDDCTVGTIQKVVETLTNNNTLKLALTTEILAYKP
jgi:hypothetical protein